jgi:hypothetical protein
VIDDRDRNKDSDCADFFSAFNVMIVPGLFFINPILALIVLAVLTVGAVGESIVSRPRRPTRTRVIPAPSPPVPEPTLGGLIWKFAALYATIAVAMLAAFISPWLLASMVLAFIVWWTKFRPKSSAGSSPGRS